MRALVYVYKLDLITRSTRCKGGRDACVHWHAYVCVRAPVRACVRACVCVRVRATFSWVECSTCSIALEMRGACTRCSPYAMCL